MLNHLSTISLLFPALKHSNYLSQKGLRNTAQEALGQSTKSGKCVKYLFPKMLWFFIADSLFGISKGSVSNPEG